MAQTTSLLRNKYWVLRHGRSIPNERGLIVSGEKPPYDLLNHNNDDRKMLENYSKRYSRKITYQLKMFAFSTPPFREQLRLLDRVVTSALNIQFEGAQCKVMENLRERFFGPSFELRSGDEYHEIYCTLDEQDPLMRPEGGESVDDVASRLAEAIVTMESLFQGCTILVVSHGDPLQILQALLNATKLNTEYSYDDLASRIQAVRAPSILSQHRKFNLRTGELRAVI
ncbi:hypothetical protein M0R45_036321 [Rubus argutus]|uniref:Phosphoglycerate mutase n=1 Tax=Rubus argutus TaxID=59490 RepID=A0AAW1VVR5_RUBAR